MLGLIFVFSAAVSAQQQPTQGDNGQPQQPQWERRGGPRRHGMGKGGRGGGLRLMSQLNLTEAQQQQMRAIEDRYRASTTTQREELRRLHESARGAEPSAETQARFQALRAELGQAMKSQHQEMLGVLNAEQRTQLEQLIRERKARHEERRGRRMERQNNDDQ